MKDFSSFLKKLPETPGVYLMKDSSGKILYVGKAANLKKRVSSYFSRAHDYRIEKLVSQIAKIETKNTDTALEALILEAKLIKELDPPFNIREKDGKSFLVIEITKEEYPRVILSRSKEEAIGQRFGPFVSASHAREALRIIRKIFPFNTHKPSEVGKFSRPCFDFQVGLCPGVCVGDVSRRDYLKIVRNIRLFLEGKKEKVVSLMAKEMNSASKKMDFERAEYFKRKLFALQHIQDSSLISRDEISLPDRGRDPRIEGYDISNISGTSAVGSMVVFRGDLPDKAEYRKFKIKAERSVKEGGNDAPMLEEVLTRRLTHREWALPDIILVDGGKSQINAAKKALNSAKLRIPVVGMVKGPDRKRTDIIGILPFGISREVLIKVRDEAHRFAITYHRKVRSGASFM